MQQSRGKRWGIQGSLIWLPDGYSVFTMSMGASVVVHHACAESASVLHVCCRYAWVIHILFLLCLGRSLDSSCVCFSVCIDICVVGLSMSVGCGPLLLCWLLCLFFSLFGFVSPMPGAVFLWPGHLVPEKKPGPGVLKPACSRSQ